MGSLSHPSQLVWFAAFTYCCTLHCCKSQPERFCEKGHGYPRSGIDTCVPCPAGTWNNGTSTHCTSCHVGKWSEFTGGGDESVCTACPVGTWSNITGAAFLTDCNLCEAGRYGSHLGLSRRRDCTECAAGTFSSAVGQTSSRTCEMCPQGRYSVQIAATSGFACLPCAAGSWNSHVGAGSRHQCNLCPAGTYSSLLASTTQSACTPCAAGFWSEKEGETDAVACRACAKGKWSDRDGAFASETCIDCATGRWSSSLGATAETACVTCPAGRAQPSHGTSASYFEQVCKPCREGKYANNRGSSLCMDCPRGTTSATPATQWCNVCPNGTWTDVAGVVFAEQCQAYSVERGAGAAAILEMTFQGIVLARLTDAQLIHLNTLLVATVSDLFRIPKEALTDLDGTTSSFDISKVGMLRALMAVPHGLTVNGFAEASYTSSFERSVREATFEAVGIEPEQLFVEVQPYSIGRSKELLTLGDAESEAASNGVLPRFSWMLTTIASLVMIASVIGCALFFNGMCCSQKAGSENMRGMKRVVAPYEE